MSEEDLELLITLDDPEDPEKEDTFHQLEADNTIAHRPGQPLPTGGDTTSEQKSLLVMTPPSWLLIRLQEARRMMLGEDLDIASASFRVGYEDPSDFSRECKRHFWAPPHGDIASLRSRLEA